MNYQGPLGNIDETKSDGSANLNAISMSSMHPTNYTSLSNKRRSHTRYPYCLVHIYISERGNALGLLNNFSRSCVGVIIQYFRSDALFVHIILSSIN